MSARIRHQTAPNPDGCQHCGVDEDEHMQRWKPPVGWHAWEQPTQEQRLARMQARRNARKDTR